MAGPQDITGSLVDWQKKKNAPVKHSPPASKLPSRSIPFDAFTWAVYGALFVFLLSQLALLILFDVI